MTDNELIAEFMGLVKCDPDLTYNLEHWRVATDYPEDKTGFVAYGHQLKYDKSWDWLMPVVEKCFNSEWPPISGKFEEWEALNSKINGALQSVDISQVHKRVVEFIRWYKSVQQ